ncbi:hypothetical protein P175DRAFT_060675 [Aspergillus ochraceoroseus IBT 24754]|uniref:Nucleoporin NSP1 n=2 Tax=Aspergillus subgen. Nidulantes TaxID=2720870 RepID=A0A0F8XAS9_9EURO|nr:uncharacterized protein P175DRAFT_060675 [Aspergillus ochraceoroseus IBT 24754]KKK26645.1 hypothetical protein ARAM_006232 [Aspergillus rambellii]PTU25061.1 hypothetical protein P175DRAFT_060675 [Aspergillus ochraceoroseus IBT 24754]
MFNFKAPASSGASGNNMFGSAGATSNTGSNGGGGLFGNVGATTSSGTTTPTLFGTSSATGQGPSPFGAGSSTPSFSFGDQSKTGPSTAQPSSLFGAASQTPKQSTEAPASGQTATSGLFGSAAKPAGTLFGNTTTTPAQSGTTTLFGSQPSTTPAGPPPQGGAPAQGQSLFGQAAQAQKPGGIFGSATLSTTTQPAATSTATSTPSLFGGAAAPTGGGFFKPGAATEKTPAFGTTPSSTPALGSGLFGDAGASKPAESTTPATTAASTTKALFGNAPAAGAQPSSLFGTLGSGAATATKPAFPSLTGTTTAQTLASPAASSATPQKSLFPTLGGTTSSATPSSTPAAAAPSGGLFGGLGASKPAETPTTQPAPAAGGLFNKPAGATSSATPAPSTATGATTTTAAKPSLATTTGPATLTPTATAGTAPAAAPTAAGGATLGASTAGPTPPAQSRLKNKTMDEIITRWATDLTKYQKEFREQAEKVAEWDRMLVENGTKVQKLYGSTVDAERATQEIERQLASVEGQQEELSSWLDRYEREVDEMMSKQVGPGESLQGPDQERERTYKLAEKLSERLDDMGKDLSSMIEEVNSASATLSKTSKADEPISQIVRILNSHLSQLQAIDQGTTELQTKVSTAQKAGRTLSSRFGHGFSTSGMGNGSAADDFYRSYMGRR